MKAIVIPCHDRAETVNRLLGSLELVNYSAEVALVFCVDFSGSDVVGDFAESYQWKHGPKVVHRHPENIGLRKNILFCGDLTNDYEGVVVLEDDTVVSPGLWDFVDASSEFYLDDRQVAQISIYPYEYDEIVYDRFHPAYAGIDVYLMRWASSRGQYWSRRQWCEFREWYDRHSDSDLEEFAIPPAVKKWKVTSWKKYFLAYLVDADKWTIYPYHGYATNYGDTGQHFRKLSQPLVQVPIAWAAPKRFRFDLAENIVVRYDSYFQPEISFLNKLNPELALYDYSVDFNLSRSLELVKTPYLLSCRTVKGEAERSFGNGLFPVDLNLAISQEKSLLTLAKVSEFEEEENLRSRAALTAWTRRQLIQPSTDFKFAAVRSFMSFCLRIAGSSKLKKIKSIFSGSS